MSNWDFSLDNARCRWVITAIIGLPVLLIIPEDTGTAIVFSSFLFMLFREGISLVLMLLGLICVLLVSITLISQSYWEIVLLIIGLTALCWYFLFKRRYWLQHVILGLLFIGLVSSVEFVLDYVLKAHQKTRILALFNPDTDPLGTGWNTIQSKIAVGSGGWVGKGFLSGTQTKYDFVPQQDTDFIFCTIGEEHGWTGSTLLLVLFFVFLAQLLYVAENSKSKYARIYGYSVTGIFFFHIAINVGMVIGVAPVIGIPLPFFSYGGSSLLSFTIMLFMVLNYYSNRTNILMDER
jgi:rod shape determining protein RodA